MCSLRFAQPRDAAACRLIYAPYIETTVTFETALPSVEEFAARLQNYGAVYPWLLAEEEGQPLAYAYAHRAQERAAYDWNAELSVYVSQHARGRGLGTRLYGALLALLEQQGVRNAYGVIALPNDASQALHDKLGFRPLGIYHRTGYKHGRWCDVIWYERQLGSFDEAPQPLRPIGAVAQREEMLREF